MKLNTRLNSSQKNCGMNIDSLMIWLLKLLKDKEDMFGPVRTMMGMYSQILWLKVIFVFI